MSQFISALVADKRQVASKIWTFKLAVEPEAFIPARPGAHIDVHLPSGQVRQYSLCRVPEPNGYDIAVLREPDGRGGSLELCDRVSVGDRLQISGPRNNFALESGKRHYVLVAGGIGITPLLPMAETLSKAGASFEFHICAARPEAVPFRSEIDTAPWSARVIYHFAEADPSTRLIVPEMVKAIGTDAQLYVCGPGRMLDAVQEATQGWPAGRLRIERFAPIEIAIDPADEGSFSVQAHKSQKSFYVQADTTLLDALLAHDVYVDSSCHEGTCGTCVTKVLSGDLIHRDSCLYPEEQAAGNVMAVCVSRARPGTTLILDV
ncbi:MAG TPA: PDR/VanB family oxidoreductase [Pseudorhizobium sp.]|jgi:vanillate O-demethylase ferredoxin subunit|nr:PDR/VanB family oxidoreductase [Pseudorhizobium sp.]